MEIQSYRDLKVWQMAMEFETHLLLAERIGIVTAGAGKLMARNSPFATRHSRDGGALG